MKLSTRFSAILFLISAFGVGALNYFFQVRAALRLNVEEFGRFSAWFSILNLALISGTIAQYVGAQQGVSKKSLRRLAWIISIAGVGLPALICFFPLHARSLSSNPFLLTLNLIFTTTASTGFCLLYGGLQRNAALTTLALASWIVGGLKLGLTYLPLASPSEAIFYEATHAAFLLGFIFLLVETLRSKTFAASGPSRLQIPILATSTYLAFCGALFPNLDLLILSVSIPVQALGKFSQSLLVGKAIYFGGASLLQLALPFQLRTSGGARSRKSRLAELGPLAAVLVTTPIVVALSPLLMAKFLGSTPTPTWDWLGLIGWNSALLFVFQWAAQRNLSRGTIWKTLPPTLAMILALALIPHLRALSPPNYLKIALGVRAVIAVFLML